jgi:general secretion pathway protein G
MKTINQNGRPGGGPKHSPGFTLVEMLLVLTILATLAAIVTPRFINHAKNARIIATKAQIAAIKTAMDTYNIDNGHFPKGQNGLQELIERPRNADNWHGPYLEEMPQDAWKHNFIYESPGKHHPDSYDLISTGEDGVAGTEDDIVNWKTGK